MRLFAYCILLVQRMSFIFLRIKNELFTGVSGLTINVIYSRAFGVAELNSQGSLVEVV